jgi:hypothetical protein
MIAWPSLDELAVWVLVVNVSIAAWFFFGQRK